MSGKARDAVQPSIPPEVLRDRWEGLKVHVNRFNDGDSEAISELWSEAYSAICTLYEGVARQSAHETYVDGKLGDWGGITAAECLDLVGEHMARRIAAEGLPV